LTAARQRPQRPRILAPALLAGVVAVAARPRARDRPDERTAWQS